MTAESKTTRVIGRVRVYITEDRDRVVRALENMARFPQIETVEEHDHYSVLQGVSNEKESLEPLRRILRTQRTLEVARSYMLRTLTPTSFSFELHKQAAYAGAAVFCSVPSESPLGPISFRVESDNPQAILDWLATPTVDGVPIDELGKRNIKRKPIRGHDDVSIEDELA